MMWAVIGIFILGSISAASVVFVKSNAQKASLEKNLKNRVNEEKKKKEIVGELYELCLGLGTSDEFEELTTIVAEMEDAVRGEQGRVTITTAEQEAVEARLRELEEVERELEASSLDAAREVEMLRSQEKDIRARNDALMSEINVSIEQLDILLGQLEDSQLAQEQLTDLKEQIVSAQEKIDFYTEDIAKLNSRYMSLKNAYDALDIEYAQLYEKQNQMEQSKSGGI